MMPSPFRRFLKYIQPYLRYLLPASFAGMVRFLIPLAIPWGIKVIVDEILERPQSAHPIYRLHVVIFCLIGSYFLWTGANYLRLYFTGVAGNRVLFDLRQRLYRHVQAMSMDFFDRRKIGAIISRLTSDINAVQQLVSQGVTAAFMDVVSVAVIAGVMLSIHWKLAVVSFSVIPLYALSSKFFTKKIRAASRSSQQHQENLLGYLHEKVSGMLVIQSFAREKEEEAAFFENCQQHLRSVLKNVHWQALGLSLTGFLAGVAPIFVIWYGALEVHAARLSVGELMAFYAYVGLLYTPISRLTELNVMIANSLAALDRIFEVFDTYPKVQEKIDAAAPAVFKGDISFRKVFFEYGKDEIVFKDINFEIHSGDFVVLLGPSGSGKSTLAKLLFRFYDVKSGAILLDGFDLRDFQIKYLRNQIAFVPQESILFTGTVLENILYGREKATREDAVRAAQAADAHDFILELPEQYETQVGERGLRLSMGERQKIAIARAFVKNPSILILDEPTASLDAVSAVTVEENLRNLRKGKTTIVISHRPLMRQLGDRFFRLQEHQVTEENGFSEPHILERKQPN